MLWSFLRLECRGICIHNARLLWCARTSEAIKLIPQSHGWRKTAVASLVIALFGLPATSAHALALGRITVQSALGEPLRAEIDIPEINADEAATLKPSLARPEAFRAAGLEFNQALTGLQISLQRRADGRAYLRLTSDRSVSEPFVDLILEANWSSGRIVRDYTVLLDPPTLRARAPVTPVTPQVVAPAVTTPRVASAPTPVSTPATAAATTRPAVAATAAAPAAAASARPNKVTVRRGDTASQIANSNKPAQVSLDQMLVALLRANADAFINGNLNLLKAGAVLTMPSDEQVAAIPEADASRAVIAQSRDFNAFRSKLASNAPVQQVAAADRSASGTVQAQVDDKKTSAAAPDKLTLSKGTADAKAAEDKIAQAKAAQDTSQRAAELARNVKDLSSLGAASAAASSAPTAATVVASASAAAPSSPVAITAAAPAVAPPAPAQPVAAASEAATTATDSAPAIAPAPAPVAAPAPTPTAVPAPAPAAQTSMIDQLLDNPLTLAGGGLLIALLAGLGIYQARKRRESTEVDSAFLESRLQPDSFFGASGGQKIDTRDGAATGSSMVYSPSQLDAADDVDPVAEADVYLAYGRDLQAEEILKEALRTHPGRIAIHQKLLDIYAKRRDAQAFEMMAKEAFRLVGAESADWARVCELGQGIDPNNALYRPGSTPPNVMEKLVASSPLAGMTAASMPTQKLELAAEIDSPASAPMDLDLDLDFSLDEEPASAIVEAQPTQLDATVSTRPVSSGPAKLDLDFGDISDSMPAIESQATTAAPIEVALPEIDSPQDTVAMVSVAPEDFRDQAAVSFGSTKPTPLSAAEGGVSSSDGSPHAGSNFDATSPNGLSASQTPFKAPDKPEAGMLEFDLGTLSLDLDASESPAPDAQAEPENPLATKLALAEEFVSIGDDDGARALIEEVIAEASGELKTRAQRALASLG